MACGLGKVIEPAFGSIFLKGDASDHVPHHQRAHLVEHQPAIVLEDLRKIRQLIVKARKVGVVVPGVSQRGFGLLATVHTVPYKTAGFLSITVDLHFSEKQKVKGVRSLREEDFLKLWD